MLLKIVFIAVGGGIGSVLRFLLAEGVQKVTGGIFPWGILAVNAAGCFAIGLLSFLLTGPWLVREEHRMLIIVGLLGGMTTFSTFAFQTVELGRDGDWGMAFGNFILSNGVGFLAVLLGLRLAEEMY